MNPLGTGAQRNNGSATLMWRVVHPQPGQQETLQQDKPGLEETCGQNGSLLGWGKVRHLESPNQTPNREKENQGLRVGVCAEADPAERQEWPPAFLTFST